MSRQAKKLIQEVDRNAAEDAFAAYNTCTSQLEVIQGKMNAELTAVKEKYEGKINKLQEEKDLHFEVLQTYAEGNSELFQTKKSMEFTHGTIGFRTGTPKLSTRKGFKWPAIFELVKNAMPQFIRTKEELNKEALLEARNTADLKSVGLEVVQDESFYVAPKLEEVSTK